MSRPQGHLLSLAMVFTFAACFLPSTPVTLSALLPLNALLFCYVFCSTHYLLIYCMFLLSGSSTRMQAPGEQESLLVLFTSCLAHSRNSMNILNEWTNEWWIPMCLSLCLRKEPLSPRLHCPFSPALLLYLLRWTSTRLTSPQVSGLLLGPCPVVSSILTTPCDVGIKNMLILPIRLLNDKQLAQRYQLDKSPWALHRLSVINWDFSGSASVFPSSSLLVTNYLTITFLKMKSTFPFNGNSMNEDGVVDWELCSSQVMLMIESDLCRSFVQQTFTELLLGPW